MPLKTHGCWGPSSNKRQLCWNKKTYWAGSQRLGAVTLSKSLSPLWMSAGPSIKGLVWTRNLHWKLAVYGFLNWAFLLPEQEYEVHENVSWGCWQALPQAAKARLMEGDSMWPGAGEPPTSEHPAWEILGNLPGPWFFPFGKDREITCLSGLLWGHKNGHKAFSQIQSSGLQNALELSHEKSNQRRSRDFAGFPESSLRM